MWETKYRSDYIECDVMSVGDVDSLFAAGGGMSVHVSCSREVTFSGDV
jgi:hypothetical protein